MSLADFVFRPFETLIRPLDIPYRPLPSDGPWALLKHFARLFRGVLVSVAVLSLAVEGINLAVIWGLAQVIDGMTTQDPLVFLTQDWPMLAVLGLLLFPVLPAFTFLQQVLTSQALSVCMPAAMQWQGHKAVEHQDLAFFHDLFAGQVATRIAQVAQAVQQQISVAVQSLPNFLVQFVGALILLAALSWPLALPVLGWILANIVLAWIAVPQFAHRSRSSARARSVVVGAMTDLYSNIQMVKLFAAEDSEAGAMRRVLTDTIDTQHSERRVFLSTDIAIVVINTLLWVATFAVGLWGLAAGFVTAGHFVAAVAVVQRLAANGRAFIQMGHQVFQAVGVIRDAMPVITTPPKIVDRPDARPLAVTAGEIRFDGVDFAYRPDKRPDTRVIHDLSLTVRPGEKIGLVGPSGAGKTTLVSLLLRLFEADSGAIRIDGQDIRAVTQASLRGQIGVITQEVSLLHRSVGDNIRYGRPAATEAEIAAAAALAEAAAFIEALADSDGRTAYRAHVGDRGVKLSGGQRQRVAIARVLLKNAPILILDEATSSLDSEAEAAIQQKLALLMQDKTVIAIAHRLSTIAAMDRIVVLDAGRIVEQGPPEELLRRDGLYARLWKMQTGGYIGAQEPG